MSLLTATAVKELIEQSSMDILSMSLFRSSPDLFSITYLRSWVQTEGEQSRCVKIPMREYEVECCLSLFEDPSCITEEEFRLFLMVKPEVYWEIKNTYVNMMFIESIHPYKKTGR